MAKSKAPQLPRYKLKDDQADAFYEHTIRLVERWGLNFTPETLEPRDEDREDTYKPETPQAGMAFAAVIRDLRHYVEANGYNQDPDDDATDEGVVYVAGSADFAKEDRKLVRGLKKLEDRIAADWGGVLSMQQVEALCKAEANRRPPNPVLGCLKSAVIIVASIVIFIVMLTLII